MTTLIAVYDNNGCVGRCDAKCYGAANAKCDCICGGMNHGAGKEKAIANTTERYEAWLEEYAKKHEFNEAVVPALYKTATPSAYKLARTINKQYGYNVVQNVEYRGRGKKGGWFVTGKIRLDSFSPAVDGQTNDRSLTAGCTWTFKSVKEALAKYSAPADIYKPAAQLAFA